MNAAGSATNSAVPAIPGQGQGPSIQTLNLTLQQAVIGLNNLTETLNGTFADIVSDLGDIVTQLTDQVTQQTALVTEATASVTQLSNINATLSAVFPVKVLTGSKTFDPPSIADGTSTTTTLTITGAVMGNKVWPSFSLDLTGLLLTAYVSAADTVTFVFGNLTGGAVDLASGTLAATVGQV